MIHIQDRASPILYMYINQKIRISFLVLELLLNISDFLSVQALDHHGMAVANDVFIILDSLDGFLSCIQFRTQSGDFRTFSSGQEQMRSTFGDIVGGVRRHSEVVAKIHVHGFSFHHLHPSTVSITVGVASSLLGFIGNGSIARGVDDHHETILTIIGHSVTSSDIGHPSDGGGKRLLELRRIIIHISIIPGLDAIAKLQDLICCIKIKSIFHENRVHSGEFFSGRSIKTNQSLKHFHFRSESHNVPLI